MDGNTGEQVSAVNLLLLETNISVISGDKEGRLKVRTTGEGDGLLCRNRQSVPIHWSQRGPEQPLCIHHGRRPAAGSGPGKQLHLHHGPQNQ
ncbi:MAG: DUF3048 C-terminal domain-containing protein [Dysosmobacter sp.]